MKRLSMMLMALLAGCASYPPKPLNLAVQDSVFEARRLDSPDVRQFFERSLGHEFTPWPPKSWDVTMLTLAARHFYPISTRPQAHRLLAEAVVMTGGVRPNPSREHHYFRHRCVSAPFLSSADV